MIHSSDDKDSLIKKVMDTIPKLQKRFQMEDDEEKQWLRQNCSNPAILNFLEDSTVMMLHVIDAIGQLEPVNGTTISKKFGIPKGSVSKVTRKLLLKQIISIEFLPDNKKEVYFRTTPLGKEIFHLHEALHRRMNVGINQFLQKYNVEELLFVIRGLEDTLEASWINPEFSATQAEAERLSHSVEEGSEAIESAEMNEIVEMLQQLDHRGLKKAKTILKDVFFTSFDV